MSVAPQCVAASPGAGQTAQLHLQVALFQPARALQRQSEAFAGYRQRRVVVGQRLARLGQLGVRQARYFDRAKTLFQLYIADTAANLTLVSAKAGMMSETGAGVVNSGATHLGNIWLLTLLASALTPKSPFTTNDFHPRFQPAPREPNNTGRCPPRPHPPAISRPRRKFWAAQVLSEKQAEGPRSPASPIPDRSNPTGQTPAAVLRFQTRADHWIPTKCKPGKPPSLTPPKRRA